MQLVSSFTTGGPLKGLGMKGCVASKEQPAEQLLDYETKSDRSSQYHCPLSTSQPITTISKSLCTFAIMSEAPSSYAGRSTAAAIASNWTVDQTKQLIKDQEVRMKNFPYPVPLHFRARTFTQKSGR